MAKTRKRTEKKEGVHESKTEGHVGHHTAHHVHHEGKKEKQSLPVNIVLIALIALVAIVAFYLYANNNISVVSSPYGTTNLEFYVMSQCPFGVQVENSIKPVLDKFGDSINFSLNFIATENADGTFKSLHGQAEVDGNIIQLCAAKYYPSKYMGLVVCQNENVKDIQTNWKTCAQTLGIDASTIETCFKGDEGKRLLSQSIKLAQAANAQGSPTIYLNKKQYQSGRDTLSFMRSVCAVLNNHPDCANMPKCGTDNDCVEKPDKDGKCVNPGQSDARCEYSDPVPIELIVVNSRECTTCDTTRIIQVSKELFLGLKVREVEYSSSEGKSLTATYGISMLPAYIFDSNVVNAKNYAQVSRALVKTGDKYLIHPQAAGSNYNPNLVEIPKKLDLFVMSQCPYGVAAEQNLKEVLNLFGSRINFTLRFIANRNEDGSFSSLHGQPEVDEDLRQVCAMKYNPDKYYDYIICVDQDYRNAATVWESCAQRSGLDVGSVRACSTGEEGKQLLAENIKLTNDLAIGSSPTFLINGKYQVGGALPADDIKQEICKANAGLEGCSTTLTAGSNSNVPAGGGCG